MADPHPKDIVRHGYDAVSHYYRGDAAEEGRYAPWIAKLSERVPARAELLDLGCGCGVPLAKALTLAGHSVTGVDFSEVQIQRARRLVPEATFLRADITETVFAAASFDAIVCLYTLIHLPLEEQPTLLRQLASWLRPGGLALLTVGYEAQTGTEADWLGSGAEMWWSQADSATYETWLTEAGLDIEAREFVPEDDSGHTLFWARRR